MAFPYTLPFVFGAEDAVVQPAQEFNHSVATATLDNSASLSVCEIQKQAAVAVISEG